MSTAAGRHHRPAGEARPAGDRGRAAARARVGGLRHPAHGRGARPRRVDVPRQRQAHRPRGGHHRGDSGIGRAVALAFAREGADVVLAYLEGEEEDGRRTAELVEEAGRRAIAVPVGPDLGDRVPGARRPDGLRVRSDRHPGEQRGLPDGAARRHRRHHHRAVRPRAEDEPLRDVLAVQDGAAAHAARGRASSTPRRSRRPRPRRSCWTTRRPRPASSTSPGDWRRWWPRTGSG